MNELSPAALAALSRLPPAEATAWAPCIVSSVRIVLRDATIRAALRRFYADTAKTPAARVLAEELRAAEFDGSRKGETLVAILALNDGRPIGWRQIVNIVDNVHG